MNVERLFSRFSRKVSSAAGSPLTFVAAVVLVLVWAATGPMFHYSETTAEKRFADRQDARGNAT